MDVTYFTQGTTGSTDLLWQPSRSHRRPFRRGIEKSDIWRVVHWREPMKVITKLAAAIFILAQLALAKPVIAGPDCGPNTQINNCVITWACSSRGEGTNGDWVPLTVQKTGADCLTSQGAAGKCQTARLVGGATPETQCVKNSPKFTLGGKISGLTPGTMVILADGGTTITSGNGPFTFPIKLANNDHYSVSVNSPSGQTCLMTNGAGYTHANVNNITVQCAVPPDVIDCDSTTCVSENSLATILCNALKGNVVGYVVIVGTRPPCYGGQARTPANPPATPMTPDLFMNIASVSKTLTAIGVIQELAVKNLTIDDKIAPFLYVDWTVGPGLGPLTFKELLTHQSGFGPCQSYLEIKAQIAAGITGTLPVTPASYENCNFAIFREVLPIMEGDMVLDFAAIGLGQWADSIRPSLSAAYYEEYMNKHVFAPLNIRTTTGGVRCAAPPAGPTDVMSYSDATGSKPGTDWGDWTLVCGGGGWVMSAKEVFSVVYDLAKGNILLTKAEELNMRNNFLGWDNAVSRNCGDINVCKNGGLGDSSGSLNTYAGILNCSLPVVIFANSNVSNFLGSGDIIDLVTTAYGRATVVHATQACP